MKALDTSSAETAKCILHARNVAIRVVNVGPPSRCTMFSVATQAIFHMPAGSLSELA
jgi:hypothetical protein